MFDNQELMQQFLDLNFKPTEFFFNKIEYPKY